MCVPNLIASSIVRLVPTPLSSPSPMAMPCKTPQQLSISLTTPLRCRRRTKPDHLTLHLHLLPRRKLLRWQKPRDPKLAERRIRKIPLQEEPSRALELIEVAQRLQWSMRTSTPSASSRPCPPTTTSTSTSSASLPLSALTSPSPTPHDPT